MAVPAPASRATALAVGLASALTLLAFSQAALAAPQESVIYAFSGGSADGYSPQGPLVSDASGALYGTTTYGGSGGCSYLNSIGCGTVFKLTPPSGGTTSWTEEVVYNFQGGPNDGANPYGGAIFVNGKLYGTTINGGAAGAGTVFVLTPPASPGNPWTESVLYSFAGAPDGAYPYAGLVSDGGSLLLGTTYFGGANYRGTIFQVSLTGQAAVLHSFEGGSDGAYPLAPLAESSGEYFGNTVAGGAPAGLGTVFKLRLNAANPAASVVDVIHRFLGGPNGNEKPQAGLIADAAGALYGTAAGNGSSSSCVTPVLTGCGTVYRLEPPVSPGKKWGFNILHKFKGGNDGSSPWATLALDAKGNLHGTTSGGGSTAECGGYGCGTVFALHRPAPPATKWHEIIRHSFRSDGTDGLYPSGPLLLGAGGSSIGLASGGTPAVSEPACPNPSGASGCGVVYQIK